MYLYTSFIVVDDGAESAGRILGAYVVTDFVKFPV